MNFEELKRIAQTNLSQFDGNEQNVKHNIVMRFLDAFGHKKFDLEHAAQGSRVDINIGNKIIVETKALDKNLDDDVIQLKRYCDEERPVLAILTNGKTFRFYSPFMRVSSFNETLIYEFSLADFEQQEVADRINKLIGFDNYQNKTYLTYIEERETELKQIIEFVDDIDKRELKDIRAIQEDIEQLKSEVEKLESKIKIKQQEIDQIKSTKISEKEELFKKYFFPNVTTPATKKIEPIGHEPIPTDKITYKIYSMKKGVSAFGKFYDTKKFIVFKGSTVSNELDESFGKGAADGAYERRKDLERTGKINSNRELTEDYLFDSISQAACVVIGGSRNGMKEWKPSSP
ncbi:MAG: DUF4357 domain-containing protein [Candidatus Methanoperedens sp.]|nr:DUF4357 domain-containing protein [Candidatus Methanoperedens sp.]